MTAEQTLDLGPLEPSGPAAELGRLMRESGVQSYAGVLVCPLGEDGEQIAAPGHVPAEIWLAAVTEYGVQEEGFMPSDETGEDAAEWLAARTRHVMARVEPARDGDAEWHLNWSDDLGPAATVPVTVTEWQ